MASPLGPILETSSFAQIPLLQLYTPPSAPSAGMSQFHPLPTQPLRLFPKTTHTKHFVNVVNLTKDLGATGSKQKAYCTLHRFLFSLCLSGPKYIPLPVCTVARESPSVV